MIAEYVGFPPEPEETHWRHAHWTGRRAQIQRALEGAGESVFSVVRFEYCGAGACVESSASLKKVRIRGNYCHNRHCEPCGKARATTIATNLHHRLSARPTGRYRFITLTLRHTQDPLDDQIKRLYACFKKLRKSKDWQSTQLGGAAVLEVKLSISGQAWHPHLHVVVEGNYLSKKTLQNLWLSITGDSFVADIRGLDNPKDAAYYVAKYLGKGPDIRVWQNPEKSIEWIRASKGVRRCFTFGTWRGFKLSEKQKDATDWVELCTLTELLRRAREGEPWAEQTMLALRPPGISDLPVDARGPSPPPPE